MDVQQLHHVSVPIPQPRTEEFPPLSAGYASNLKNVGDRVSMVTSIYCELLIMGIPVLFSEGMKYRDAFK
jgi:hypothetical protein